LQVSTDATVVPATYPLTITGTSGVLSHSATATLVVNPPGTPDFDLTVSRQSLSVVQGVAASVDVTSSASGGFVDGIDITVDGLPDAVSSSFSNNPLTGSDSSALTIAAGATSAPGTYPITLTGTSGSLTHAATFDLIVKPPADFSLTASPTSQSTSTGGTTGSYKISNNALNGLTGSLDLSVSGLPFGAAAHFTADPVPLGTDSELTVSTLDTIAIGSFDFTVNANSGNITHSISLVLNVDAVPDFSVSLSAASRSVEQGGTTSPYTLTAAPMNGFSHDLGLSVGGLPAGATAVFTPSQIPAGAGSSDLAIVTTSSTSPGTYPLKIKLDGTTLSHTVDATLTVSAAADFTLSATPNSQTIAAGATTGAYKIAVTAQNGFAGQTTLGTSGLPPGATATFSPNPLAAGANSNLTINTAPTLAPGTYSFNVTAVSGSLSHNVPATLVVTGAPDFGLSATPASRTAMQGQAAGPFALTVSAANGFVAPVALTVSGLPAGATGTFSTTTISGSGTSNLTIATSPSTPSGSYPLTINGTSGSLSHAAAVTLSVTAAAGTVSGKVTNISTGGALSGATVSYSGGSTLTSSTGTYSFSSVPAGTLNFTATRTGYGSRTIPVSVTAGGATTANFQLATSGRLTGTVKNSAGASISSATVKVVGGVISTSATLTTNSSGVYLSGWLPIGNYTITVSKTGYTTQSAAATVATGTTSTFSFTMH
jgi:uncharacterized membrane protein